ncbi:arabinogalactan endo-1,4-beta-galactosidase [Deinococcus metalli]|uniref:Arabinogalactan endo-beta-1,4-galactanase n=1 Tax=Deinococcus metalli TaxID=1141878 RepID=A0A7W8KF40_9DEIO|nr:glycosyl hydrolase 53 family protein [Deinococcus metalli]MBB5377037.1 arabinogalactan endo-1,4-beta-galactosidase [Deinococcus metalli]GHF49396.1 hypothetical protein GCM10017781_27380 [Deinococcus metalli]
MTALIPPTLLLALTAGLISCASSPDVQARATAPLSAQASPARDKDFAWIRGVDVSEARDAELHGVQFRDTDGKVRPALKIVKDHKFGWVRVRLMVDPDGRYGLAQDLPYVKAMLLDAKKQNLHVLLDLHYSHWWADPGGQWTPPRWQGQDARALETSVYDYTRDVITQLRAQDTPPDMVQVGNEINGGMLWEVGRIRNDDMTTFAKLTNAGVRAVRDASGGPATTPPVMIHIAKIGDAAATVAWYRAFQQAGGQFDTIGISYYPMWHGSFAELDETIRALNAAFAKPVYVAETALYWAPNEKGYTNVPYPQTPQGQLDYLRALSPVVQHAGGHGIFYWGAFWSQSAKWLSAPGWTDDDASRRALFDDDAKATPAIDGLN